MKKTYTTYTIAFIFFLSLGLFLSTKMNRDMSRSSSHLNILTYSSFLKDWGPGRKIADTFLREYNISINWIEVPNAGMLIEHLKNKKNHIDAVVGIDLLSLDKAKSVTKWLDIKTPSIKYNEQAKEFSNIRGFVPYDWSPMTFVIKNSRVNSPKSLLDLLKPEYENSLSLQNPTTSSSGLYFLIWIYSVYGKDKAKDYLKKLKKSVRVISPSWSSSYSLFQNGHTPIVFSFFTSVFYHYINEQDFRYQPVYFVEPHIFSMEFAGVLKECEQCEAAINFVRHLLSQKSQTTIMNLNYMLPVVKGVQEGTDFDYPDAMNLLSPESYMDLVHNQKQILKFWSKINF